MDRVLKQMQDILQKDTRGLTVKELAEQTRVSRITASIALARLEGMGLIEVRVIGNCRLHYWRDAS
jgi:DNA-binding MarR family transcriptional regulator